MKRTLSYGLMCCAIALATAACTPTIDVRGNVPSPDRLQQVKVGQTTRDEVAALLGTPSSTPAFGDDRWYYISSTMKSYAFFAPEELSREVIEVSFDPKTNVVNGMRHLGLKDGKEVDLVSRETPTAGKELTVLEQLLGNLGRFSADSKRSNSGTVPTTPGPGG